MPRRVRPGGLQIVLYHHLADAGHTLVDGLGVATPAALFDAHLDRLERDYEIVDLDAVLAGGLPRRALLITFDDGYRSVLDVALPRLARRGLPSVFFVSAAFVAPGSLPLDNLLSHLFATAGAATVSEAITGDADAATTLPELFAAVATLPYTRRFALGDELAERFGADRAALRDASGLFLDAAELRDLAAHGCALGNHTRSHLFCRAITDDAAAADELVEHREQLEAWAATPVRSFSYPYGCREDATPFVERALRASGHEASFLVEARRNRPSHPGPTWNRVSLDSRPAWRLPAELDVLPALRSARDRLRPPAVSR